MLVNFRNLLCGLSIVLFAACGGGSTGSSTFSLLDNQGAELANAAAALSVREPDTLPRNGSATFSGVLGFSLANGESYDGILELDANLTNDSISGSVTDFVNLEGGTVGGTLTISRGNINRTVDVEEFYIFAAPLGGILVDQNERVGVDGYIVGQFLGDARQMVSGVVRGNIFFDGARVTIVNSGFFADCDNLPEECQRS